MLAGSRVLVVEDEALIAMGISAMLTDAEAVPVGPASSVREARQLIRDLTALDAAVLDVNLADGAVTPILEALSARGIPTVIYTGGVVPEDVRRRHPDLIALSKPVLPARLIGELRKAIGAPRPHRSRGRPMESVSQRFPARSRHVVVRFSLKLAVFLIICGLQTRSGGPNPFFEVTAFAVLCLVLALYARERPLGPWLNYWDEAVVFGLVSRVGGILGFG